MKKLLAIVLILLLLAGCTSVTDRVGSLIDSLVEFGTDSDPITKPVWPGLPEDYPQSSENDAPAPPPGDDTPVEVPIPEPEEPADNPIAQPVPMPPEPAPEPEHSALYLPDVPVEDVIMYFNEVCLDAEFVIEGDPSRLQKWDVPIAYEILGEPTPEDRSVVENFAAWLNTVEGFPGIRATEDDTEVNLRIHFCTADELLSIMGDSFTNLDGAVTFWYYDDAIYDAVICVRTDLSQELRNSVILEEIYNGLGPVQDTELRPDSIIYAPFSQPQSLTAMDELLLKLLYHPEMICGMDAAACEAVIRSLYY